MFSSKGHALHAKSPKLNRQWSKKFQRKLPLKTEKLCHPDPLRILKNFLTTLSCFISISMNCYTEHVNNKVVSPFHICWTQRPVLLILETLFQWKWAILCWVIWLERGVVGALIMFNHNHWSHEIKYVNFFVNLNLKDNVIPLLNNYFFQFFS